MQNKNILIGITGGIAAYKVAILVRLLVKEKANVKIIMTPFATNFITPLTLSTLSKNPVLTDFFDAKNGQWNSHVDLGIWADAFIIAPATANSIAKMAHGIADNLLLTTYLSVKCPIFFAPTMDLDMYKHQTTTENIKTLINRNHICIEPQTGELASGLSGKGRMAEPEIIINSVKNFFINENILKNKNVIITAGPTYEHIDPVRFIGNHSSGKMGIAIADKIAEYGANVTLICGPIQLKTKNKNIKTVKITSANEMNEETINNFKKADIAILAAAVADYTPEKYNDKKIKKNNNEITIKLKKTPDIAYNIGKIKQKNQKTIGFALETDNEIKNAQKKLTSKNFDFIVLNSLNDKGAGFNSDTNKITIIEPNNKITKFNLKNKNQVAIDIINKIIQIL